MVERVVGRSKSARWQREAFRTLHALGGEATLGDIVALTGLSRKEVERALEALMADDCCAVKVLESGDVVYHLGEPWNEEGLEAVRRLTGLELERHRPADLARVLRAGFDRKTLQLIRAREGVVSLAELVEHTGLPLTGARAEMERLAETYGGVPQPSLDGHVVYTFPELMTSTHGRFALREPRPAWVRLRDPIRATRRNPRKEALILGLNGLGVIFSAAAPWLVADAPATAVLPVMGAAATGLVVFGRNLTRALGRHPVFRYRHATTVRRYLLGHVIETALAGKGVVSLDRATRYLQARAGRRRVKRSAVEVALRDLAAEFDAPITELDGDLFFGFRNVKRQYVASHIVRRELRLGRTASGSTVFDSADPPLAATQRDLEAFDRELRLGHPTPPGRETEARHASAEKIHDDGGAGD